MYCYVLLYETGPTWFPFICYWIGTRIAVSTCTNLVYHSFSYFMAQSIECAISFFCISIISIRINSHVAITILWTWNVSKWVLLTVHWLNSSVFRMLVFPYQHIKTLRTFFFNDFDLVLLRFIRKSRQGTCLLNFIE